jgi:hypothetical protein
MVVLLEYSFVSVVLKKLTKLCMIGSVLLCFAVFGPVSLHNFWGTSRKLVQKSQGDYLGMFFLIMRLSMKFYLTLYLAARFIYIDMRTF